MVRILLQYEMEVQTKKLQEKNGIIHAWNSLMTSSVYLGLSCLSAAGLVLPSETDDVLFLALIIGHQRTTTDVAFPHKAFCILFVYFICLSTAASLHSLHQTLTSISGKNTNWPSAASRV